MSAKKIKSLIVAFLNHHDMYSYAEHKLEHARLAKSERTFWENDKAREEEILHEISNQVKKLKPSRYMMKKYKVLEDIIDETY